jgi:glycosyltransferase involved in cell wall biosynthesis
MRIAYITAGAAGMFCGSCLHDNTLVAELQAQGCDALLIPTYTPLRTDEPDVSLPRVFFGGLNVYLQQKSALFRHTPWMLDRWLDQPALLRWLSRFAVQTDARQLGELTVSMLQGKHGRQRKEVDKLVHWLAQEIRPQVVNLSNVLLSGLVPELKAHLGVPLLATLQGDDIFLEALPEPYRTQALELIRTHCQQIEGFIATCGYYADFMSEYLHIPRQRIDVVYPGIRLHGYGPRSAQQERPRTIGYFARICPEKGLHLLVEAFCRLRQQPHLADCRLHISGWLGREQQAYWQEQCRRVQAAGLSEAVAYLPAPDHAHKARFYQGIDLLSVPTTYREPKGLYVLEAWANAVPVVQPAHGSFPELLQRTGGGLLVRPHDVDDLVHGLRRLLEDAPLRQELGRKGQLGVQQYFTAEGMARNTLEVYRKYLAP